MIILRHQVVPVKIDVGGKINKKNFLGGTQNSRVTCVVNAPHAEIMDVMVFWLGLTRRASADSSGLKCLHTQAGTADDGCRS